MDTSDDLKKMIVRQKEMLAELEVMYQSVKGDDLTKENAALKADMARFQADYEKSRTDVVRLSGENAALKNTLYEQIFNERAKIINATQHKLDVYFQSNVKGEQNRLTELENSVKSRIDRMRETLQKNHVDAKDEIFARLEELSDLLDHKLTEARAGAARLSAAFSQAERDEFEALKNEPLSDEQVRAVAKKNNLERFVGLNVLNAIGVFLLIVGVITVARYTYVRLTDVFKGMMMFGLGGVMLAAGELLNRKKPNVFSLGISAGGVGILYVALATSFFALKILGMYPAILLCMLITAGAFVLSNRYHAQIIAVFALIGGYLPMFSIDSSSAMIYGAMAYFIALNLLALLISFHKKWRVTSFVGLFHNAISTVYICLQLGYVQSSVRVALAILYVLFAFWVYTAIPIISTYRTKAKFRKSDVVLLAINTFFGAVWLYAMLYSYDLDAYAGLFTIAFAATYLLVGRFIETKFANEEPWVTALMYLTGLAFVVLAIPMQFGRAWLSLGWLAEGVLLATYGVLKNDKRLRKAGYIISLLCLCAFGIFDVIGEIDHLFAYKYLAITLGSLVILGAYMYKKSMSGRFVRIYKHFAIANTWLYLLYVIGKLESVLYDVYANPMIYNLVVYLSAAVAITMTFAMAYAIARIKLLSGLGTKIQSIVLYAVGILWLFYLNAIYTPIVSGDAAVPFGVTLIGVATLVVVGLLSVFAVRDLMKLIVTERQKGVEWVPVAVSGYFVLMLTQNLTAHLGLSFASAWISILYVLTALAWILFGFVRRYAFIRRFGLGLAILAAVKLFVIDLHGLTQGYRIASYFALGITLIAISFVYQYFNKRLERKEALLEHAETKDEI